ncbi:MAG: cold shock domain-containing protein, partial [Aeromicrobium sp.]|nr:cold shock domain-containing protein [Aeromicrobium sp.]
MRGHGRLSAWNDERGFGFIEPDDGGPRVFAHINEFP